jgi:hypothetical protein
MAYPEYFIAPMRQELTQHGVVEAREAADVTASSPSRAARSCLS